MKLNRILFAVAGTTLLACTLLTGCGSQPASSTVVPTPTPAPTAAPTPLPTPEPLQIPVDFEEWQAKNADVYAWIKIDGTRIDYPVLRSETDNTYYLNHNLDGSKGYPGCIYSENFNTPDFSDPVTILYGHNMNPDKSEPMFHDLHEYRKSEDFLLENNEILIYQPDRILHYQVYAAFVHTNAHLLYEFDFYNKDSYQSFLNKCAAAANVDDSLAPTTDDRLVVLSTCTGVDTQRLLVVGVLMEDER